MATVSSITTPIKSQGSKESRIQSIYNPINFVFNFEDASLTDKFQMKIKFADDSETNVYTYSVLNTSSMRRDVSSIIKKYLITETPLAFMEDAFDSDVDTSIIAYKILYKFIEDEAYLETDFFYATSGVFQLGHALQGNFLEYLSVYDNNGANVGNIGKFLTNFEKPVHFKNFPFFLAFISPLELNQENILDVAMYLNGIEEPLGELEADVAVKRYINPQGDQPTNDIYISTGGSLGEDVFSDEFDDTFWGDADEGAFELIERKEFETVCTDNYKSPICLVWLNALGGWDVWVFDAPTINTRYTDDEYAYKPIDSLTATDFGSLLNRDVIKSIVCTSQKLNANRYNTLQEMIASPLVYWRISDTYYMQVKVSSGSFPFDTKRELFDFSVEIQKFYEYAQF